MFKTRLVLHKETLIVLATGVLIITLLVVNVAVFVPTVLQVYSRTQSIGIQTPIDVDTVNKAIEYLSSNSATK